MNISPYIKYYILTIEDNLNYKKDFIIKFLTGFIESYAKVAVWYSILISNQMIISGELMNDTIKYIILASVITYMIFISIPEDEITSRILSGTISNDLVLPISLPITLFFKSLGNFTEAFITRFIPSIFVLTLLYDIKWNLNPINILVLVIGTMLGFYIYFNISIQVDMLSFWIMESYSLHNIKEGIFLFFSGSLIPLWFYPEFLLKIINLLPFKNIIYLPISYYLGKVNHDRILAQIIECFIWVIIFSLITYIMWKKGKKKVVINGG